MKYNYTGPVCRTHLLVNGKRERVKLHPGEVELPEGHSYTLGLIARKLLTPVVAAPAPTPDPEPELATKPGHRAARRNTSEGASE